MWLLPPSNYNMSSGGKVGFIQISWWMLRLLINCSTTVTRVHCLHCKLLLWLLSTVTTISWRLLRRKSNCRRPTLVNQLEHESFAYRNNYPAHICAAEISVTRLVDSLAASQLSRPFEGSRQIGPRTVGPRITGPRTVGPRGPVVQGPTVRLEKVANCAPDSWAPEMYHPKNK